MERSKKIFLEISSTSDKVTAAANKYADRKGVPCVQRSHFQLEADMRKISFACNTLADSISGRLSLPDDPVLDIRIQDWLSSDEPRVCLDTLSRMERLLRKDTSPWKTIFTRRSTTSTQDKIKEAIDLLDSCRTYFHFLSMPETWNNEEVALRQQDDAPRSREHAPQAEPKRSDISDQDSPVDSSTRVDSAMPTAAIHEHEDAPHPKKPDRTTDTQRKKEQDARNFREILDWLDGLNCAEKQDVTLLLRQPDTCKWLFDTTQYHIWRNNKSSTLWLNGKPGAGKSVLASSVIDSLEKVQREGEILAFFYCDFRNERSTSASEVLRSILFQLLYQLHDDAIDPGSLIDDLIDAKKRGGATRNNIKELARFTSRTAVLFTKRPLVIVDALDECKDVESLLEGLNALGGSVQLFITSRPLPAIKDGLFGVTCISMDDMVGSLSTDIALHVSRELDGRRRLRDLAPSIKTKIRFALCHKADGMFRWVQCAIDTLDRCVTKKELLKALDDLPEGLDETYERILLAINTETREGKLALRALVWLVAALRPLTIDELIEGLSIDLEAWRLDFSIGPMHKVALLDACGSLVTYSENTGMIILSHFSVKEYLVSSLTRAKLPKYHINWECAHLQLVKSSICYLSVFLKRSRGSDGHSNGDFFCLNQHETSSHLVSHALRRYVIENALDHFRYIQIKLVLRDVEALAKDIERNSWVWDDMCGDNSLVANPATPTWPLSNHDLPLYILVAFAPDSDLRTYLRRPVFKSKEAANPLIYAAYFNKHDHAKVLLSRGAKLNCRGWDIVDPSLALPIEVAIRNGHHSMVNFFVLQGSIISPLVFADLLSHSYGSVPSSTKRMLLQSDDFVEAVNGQSCDPRLRSFDSLKGFLVEGIHGKDLTFVVRRFIQVNLSDSRYLDFLLYTALEYFREDDALEIVNMLTDYGCDLRQIESNSSGKLPLSIAVQRAHVSAAQCLVSLGVPLPPSMLVATLRSWDSELTTPIGMKAQMVRFLIENGVDVHERTEAGDSVLHIALQSYYEEDALQITKLLVDHRCDPREADSSGNPPLHIAVERAHISVVQYLLSLGIPLLPDILIRLNLWGIWRTARMIRFLVKNGADVRARTETGDSVFHVVLDFFQDEAEAMELAKLLVGYGCNPLEANSSGRTPLHIAVGQGHISVVQYFLSLGIPCPPDLLLVALNLQEPIVGTKITMVRLLIHKGADVHARTETGDSVFHLALKSCYEDDALEITEELLSCGCNLLEVNSSGETPLQIAIERAHTSVVQCLLSLGVALPRDILVRLSPRGKWQTVEMISFLIEKGADVRAYNEAGDPVLHVVLESLNQELHEATKIVEVLLANGCDPFELNSREKTPVWIALERGLHFVQNYLLELGVPYAYESLHEDVYTY